MFWILVFCKDTTFFRNLSYKSQKSPALFRTGLFISFSTSLFTQTESLNQGTVAVDVGVVEVLQQLTTATYHDGE